MSALAARVVLLLAWVATVSADSSKPVSVVLHSNWPRTPILLEARSATPEDGRQPCACEGDLTSDLLQRVCVSGRPPAVLEVCGGDAGCGGVRYN